MSSFKLQPTTNGGRDPQPKYTEKQVYEAILIELNKVSAPSMPLEDMVYMINKAFTNYVNRRYNIYDTSQQTTDDLAELSATFEVTPSSTPPLNQTTQVFELPGDYFHTLGCIVYFDVLDDFKVYEAGDEYEVGTRRMTADQIGGIVRDAYNRPSYKQVYHFAQDNQIQILSGTHEKMRLARVLFIYLQNSERYDLKQNQLDDETTDTSKLLRWPKYVTDQVINEAVKLMLENGANPRLNTQPLVNQTIPDQPAQMAPQAAPARNR